MLAGRAASFASSIRIIATTSNGLAVSAVPIVQPEFEVAELPLEPPEAGCFFGVGVCALGTPRVEVGTRVDVSVGVGLGVQIGPSGGDNRAQCPPGQSASDAQLIASEVPPSQNWPVWTHDEPGH